VEGELKIETGAKGRAGTTRWAAIVNCGERRVSELGGTRALGARDRTTELRGGHRAVSSHPQYEMAAHLMAPNVRSVERIATGHRFSIFDFQFSIRAAAACAEDATP